MTHKQTAVTDRQGRELVMYLVIILATIFNLYYSTKLSTQTMRYINENAEEINNLYMGLIDTQKAVIKLNEVIYDAN